MLGFGTMNMGRQTGAASHCSDVQGCLISELIARSGNDLEQAKKLMTFLHSKGVNLYVIACCRCCCTGELLALERKISDCICLCSFDSAEMYGRGESDKIFGQALKVPFVLLTSGSQATVGRLVADGCCCCCHRSWAGAGAML